MKRSYSIRIGNRIAVADLSPPGECGEEGWWVNRINVPDGERGKGYGSRLLKMILHDADLEGVTIALIPLASPGWQGLNDANLEDWYKRYGFTWRIIRREVIDGDVITEQEMRRDPGD